MIRFRHLIAILLLVCSPALLKGQEHEVKVGIRAGYNAAFGGYGSFSLETAQTNVTTSTVT